MGFFKAIKHFTYGAAAGAAAMYLLDPAQGRGRRAELSDRAGAMGRDLAGQAQGAATMAADRAQGAAMEATRPLRDTPPPDDRTLVDRIRSEVMGQPRFDGLNLNIDANEGVVAVRGVCDDQSTREEICTAIGQIPGVRRVESFMHATGTVPPNTAEVIDISAQQERSTTGMSSSV